MGKVMTTSGRARRFFRWKETEYWQVWALAFLHGSIFFGAYALIDNNIVGGSIFGALLFACWGIARGIQLKSRRDTRVVQGWTPPRLQR
jgi:4-hydroxybenzoate polyprenyltransferase